MDASRQCRARSKRFRQRSKRAAIRGGFVCSIHGGASPQVLAAARERIATMVDPALAELRRLIDSAESDSVRLQAIKDVLDRAGYKPTDRSEVNMTGGGVHIYLPARGDLPINGSSDPADVPGTGSA